MTLNEVVDTWLSAWSEPDEATRLELLRKTVLPDIRYISPTGDVVGHEGVNQMIDALHKTMRLQVVKRVSKINHHHDVARYQWEFSLEDGNPFPDGYDVAEIDPETGKLAHVTVFMGDLIPLAQEAG
ncbi:hypothetical protein [Pseudooceanicola sp.]|uniref:hypothetical protein n=1 Tax=Pseudooceanicola sp. TaxID=1914328 RepID=UPI0026279760|nr:hypothetical protein [Pseudooceanicola sp.]MDF1854040.1 hypothetical protein [Pseudooceanicola sp.]